jgi:hypothetical protein
MMSNPISLVKAINVGDHNTHESERNYLDCYIKDYREKDNEVRIVLSKKYRSGEWCYDTETLTHYIEWLTEIRDFMREQETKDDRA